MKSTMDQSLLALLDSDDLTQVNFLNHVSFSNHFDSDADKTFLELDIAPLQASDPVSISKDLQIPLDPHQWDTSHVLRWVEWTLRQTNVDDMELWRISGQLRERSITGNQLTGWNAFEYDQMFLYSGETLRKQMVRWIQGISDFYIGQAPEAADYEYTKLLNINTNNNISQLNSQINDPSMYPASLSSALSPISGDEDFLVDLIPSPTSSSYSQGSASPLLGHEFPQGYPAYTWPVEDDTRSRGSTMSGSWSSSDEEDFLISEQERPKVKPTVTKRRHPILYKFILEHLNNPTASRGCVEWVDKSKGLFKFNSRRKDKFAEMWSKAKGKKQPMTYQNMARALRNYTRPNRRIMERVPKKLHYKFMPEFIE